MQGFFMGLRWGHSRSALPLKDANSLRMSLHRQALRRYRVALTKKGMGFVHRDPATAYRISATACPYCYCV